MKTLQARQILETVIGKNKIVVGRYTNPVRVQMENWVRIATVNIQDDMRNDLGYAVQTNALLNDEFRLYFTDTEFFIYVRPEKAEAVAKWSAAKAQPAEETQPTQTVEQPVSNQIPHPNKEKFACPQIATYGGTTRFRQDELLVVRAINEWLDDIRQTTAPTVLQSISETVRGNRPAFITVHCWENRYCIVQLGNTSVFAIDKQKFYTNSTLKTERFETLNDAWNAVYNAQQHDQKLARYHTQQQAKLAAQHAAQEAADAEAEEQEEEEETAPDFAPAKAAEKIQHTAIAFNEIRTWEDFTAFMQTNPDVTVTRNKDNARVVGFEPYNDKAVELELDNGKTSYPFYHVLARYFTVSHDQPN